jgi:hypothetical protein
MTGNPATVFRFMRYVQVGFVLILLVAGSNWGKKPDPSDSRGNPDARAYRRLPETLQLGPANRSDKGR